MIKNGLLTLFAWLLRALLSLRYRIRVEGLEQVIEEQRGKRGGILFLPNHPAEIDPVILMALLWRPFHPRPLVVEHFYYLKGFHAFIRAVRALPLPTMDAVANSWKAKQIDKALAKIREERERGDNFLVYPAGKLKLGAAEVLGGASFLHTLLTRDPEANIVLIRTTGLWGSLFSRAITGRSPDFGNTLFQGLKTLLQNGIFFAPRRQIVVEFVSKPADFPLKASRLDLNRYLENWYNQYPKPGPEQLSLVSSLFWKSKLPEVANDEKKREAQKIQVPPGVEKEIRAQLAALTRLPPEKIEREMHLSYDLGLDSLDLTQLYLFLEERSGGKVIPPEEIQTVEDLLQAAAGAQKEREVEEEKPKVAWPEERGRVPPVAPLGKTVQEAFLRSSDRMGRHIACADALSGLLSYPKLKRAALVLSLKIRAMEGEKIGILLPSSCAAYLLILATLLAKKTPVMLNWTTGVRALEHASKLTQLKTVISSMRFLGRKEVEDLGSVDEKIVLLEDLRFTIGLKEKLVGLFYSWQKAGLLLKTLGLDATYEEEPAVILFTSGTESLPKGVPLTHANILSNQRAAFSCIDLGADDRLLGVLPPFHSFGFSVTGLLPLLCGLQVAYAPDPTDSHALATAVEHWKPTLFCAAPSFIRALFRAASPAQLSSIKLFVSGAEKAPPELFEYVAKLGKDHEMIEGYGITECAPIVTITLPKRPRKGVGTPLPGIELCVIDPETKELLPTGKEGEICISGPNVFPGYIGNPPSPFIQLQGKRWYRSSDRGFLDTEGNLTLSGRLRRFVKIGGEMVSLAGLEEELLRLAQEKQWAALKEDGPQLAVAVREKESEKPLLILITTFPVDLEMVNRALKESGYGRLIKIAEVKQVHEIPLTGTGKTHYRLLDEMISHENVKTLQHRNANERAG